MKTEMLKLLICPHCKKTFHGVSFKEEDNRILEGLLSCDCGRMYPVVDSIPRILPGAFSLYPDFARKYKDRIGSCIERGALSGDAGEESLKKKTQASFGYQWTSFSQMSCDFRENFLNYIHPVKPEFFKGKLGLDMGCGFGRHIYNAAKFGADMIGVDYSRAIESTYHNTRGMDNVSLAQADVYNLPFSERTFDFVYSIGVLHHLPQPERGFQALEKLLKPRGSVFIWVYSSRRKWSIKILELARKITTRMPFPLLKAVCFVAAVIDYYFFILPFRLLGKNRYLSRFIFPRVRLYCCYPFQVNFADWFDRLAAPIRFYYSGDDIKAWLERAGLQNIVVSPTGLYGWRAYGEKA